jgi:PAS domain S-box-containing protein
MTPERGRADPQPLHQAAWPDMFANLQTAYAELAQAQFDLQERVGVIQEARDLFQQVIASMSEALFLTDVTGQVITANPAASMLLRSGNTDLVGKPFSAMLGASAVPGTPWQLLELAAGGSVSGLEVAAQASDGTVVVLSMSCTIVRDKRGKIVGMLAIASDIAERKRAEEERSQLLASEQAARAEAETANRAKDEFLAILSHELRTPLNAMFGWVMLLRSGSLDAATATRGLEVIERNLRLQTQLIEDLLDVSRIVSGKLQLDIRPVDLGSIIEAAIETVSPAARAKAIDLQKTIEPLTGRVVGDPTRLQQIVWNLVSNAVKFTPHRGSVVVGLRQMDTEAQITVRDTGKGISADLLPFVFDRFRQADSSSSRVHGGLGLGLAIVRHLVELHGGTVRAESEGEGRGARFTVQLPLPTAQSPINAGAARVSLQGADADTNQTLAGMKVLVVDDGADDRQLHTLILERCGAEVTAVGGAQEAFRALEAARPDVIVSDLAMPGQDGYAMISQLRNTERRHGSRAIPAIALTAYASEEERRRTLAVGFQMHVHKPVVPADLVVAVARVAGRFRDARERTA